MLRAFASLLAATACLCLPAMAGPPAPAKNPAVVESVLACRSIPDPAQRVACYDATSGHLQSSVESGEVVVIDRARAQAANREAFGLQLPSLGMFAPSLSQAEIESQTDTITSVKALPGDRWLITLSSGAVWRQTDGRMRGEPKAGDSVEVTRGSFGGFFLKVGNQVAVKAKREI